MSVVRTVAELEAIYGESSEASRIKVSHRLTEGYRRLVEASPVVALATCGPEGLDCSPRGDPGQVISIRDDRTMLLPDRRGNNRIDSLRNIVRDSRVALLFLIPGSNSTLRVNGTAEISVEPALLASLAMEGKPPRSVIVITVGEIYFQCARALMRARLWEQEAWPDASGLPTPGALMRELKQDFDGRAYDREWPERAKNSLW
ncbi:MULTISPECIES: pyridoxamine 5'-phosphate oxidase family protein [Hoeflea]|uniref:Pyridoxamine 5'-phosphate oxidase family protein n=1 Tax=Hoeflea alexandrii TaxID=288436 RepID=A0ABT1CNR3_9HYPH|nr:MULTISPECIES: pyridoxamine 5'-phosphate oxidase family protein [Hoeflea]MCO6407830.1 pyridoxamine 5'-phosphate oxidase family protein [Hoeflea alexandrii]MCY0153807.1 pyridoxamine 5'-phosphate oxidase family protein [Hoeflea alexandrii]VVT10755.1 Flavin-nucleotide-binding protein [Hoeflea sp. EC-HK425]|tara:strand:- start:843 stop:1451 length:609 start_codon:yes stop_codon:yes gene_type:complete